MLQLFLAVAIHSTAIVFCIGTEMITTGMKKRSLVVYMAVLSVVTPVGVLLGIVVTVHMEQVGASPLKEVAVRSTLRVPTTSGIGWGRGR